MAKQLGFYFDQARCTGCKACSIACKDKHDLPVGVTWRRVVEYTGGDWLPAGDGTFTQNVFTYYTSISCNHCDNAICIEACPTTAMHRGADGVVSVDPAICIGCRYCELACPYSAPQFHPEKGVMTKCDLCADFRAEGKTPACVAACPSRALDFGEIAELRAKYGSQAGVEPLPAATATSPNLVVHPHPQSQPSGRGTGKLVKVKGH